MRFSMDGFPDSYIYIFSKGMPEHHVLGIEIKGQIQADTPDCYDSDIMRRLDYY
jgi:hypothetical protein